MANERDGDVDVFVGKGGLREGALHKKIDDVWRMVFGSTADYLSDYTIICAEDKLFPPIVLQDHY